MNTKLHAGTVAEGRPLSFFMTAGQVSHYPGAAAPLDDLPKAQWMLGDRGYGAGLYRDDLQAKGTTPCIQGQKSRIIPLNTTSAAIKVGAVSSLYSDVRRTGAGSPPATTNARPSSSPLWPSPPPSFSGFGVLTLVCYSAADHTGKYERSTLGTSLPPLTSTQMA